VFAFVLAEAVAGNVIPAPLVDGVAPPTPIVVADISVPVLVVIPFVPSSTMAIITLLLMLELLL
jgi:hypothetical protein